MLLALAPRLQAPYSRCGLNGHQLHLALRRAYAQFRPSQGVRLRKTPASTRAEEARAEQAKSERAKSFQPSLLVELFPEEANSRQDEVEIPRLRVDLPATPRRRRGATSEERQAAKFSPQSREAYREMKEQGEQTAVLVLRNASKNLVEEDFQRLIPKGKHIENWNLEEGDIVKGRTTRLDCFGGSY